MANAQREQLEQSEYQQSVDYLFGLQKFGIKLGLNRTEVLLEKLGNPHRKLKCVHVGGTNGKGSTAAMIAGILQHHGFRVGMYSSPHLVRFTERFLINGEEVSPARILEIFNEVRAVIDDSEPPTFFEVVTAMGLHYFAREEVDWAVIEVGMGGRLDATNVLSPAVSVITNVSLEHQEYLGTTLHAIAREKAGIIKQDTPVVTGATQPVVLGVLKTTCFNREAPLYRSGIHFRTKRNRDNTFRYQGLKRRMNSLRLEMLGGYQLSNAALALAAVELLEEHDGLELDEQAVARGLAGVHWPARLEVLERKPLVLLDGAHNANGAEALRDALKRDLPCRRIHMVLGIMGDKDLGGMLRRLLPLAESVIFTKPAYARSADPGRLMEQAGSHVRKCEIEPNPERAVAKAKERAGDNDCVCIAGSLYFAGEIKQLFGEKPNFGPLG